MAAVAALVSILLHFFSAQERPLLVEVARLASAGNVSSIHAGHGGRIYILANDSGERGWYDAGTQRMYRTGGTGWGLDGLDDPRSIWSDGLSVYVADRNNDRIVRYDRDLRPLSEFRTRDSSYAQARFGYPQSVAINERGDLGVLDGENDELVVFDRTGRFLFRFGRDPRSGESLSDPVDLTTNARGEWLVLDRRFVTTIDMFGTLLSQEAHDLSEPRGVEADGDRIVVAGLRTLAFRSGSGSYRRIPVRTFELTNPDAEILDISMDGDILFIVLDGALVQFRVEGFQE